MTNEQAAEELKILLWNAKGFDDETEEKALTLAIKALEKQIPTEIKSRRAMDHILYGYCPSCGAFANEVIDGKICTNCGQSLKWG